MKPTRLISLTLAAMTLAACSTLSSVDGHPPGRGTELGAYSLPKAYLFAEVIEVSTGSRVKGYILNLYGPQIRPDPRYGLHLRHNTSIFSNDAAAFRVDPKTGLLMGVNVVTEDKTDDILEAMSASASAFRLTSGGAGTDGIWKMTGLEEAAPEERRRIARPEFDPLDSASVDRANAVIRAAVGGGAAVRYLSVAGVSSTIPPRLPGTPPIPGPPAAPVVAPAAPADWTGLCGQGVCMPMMRSVTVTLSAPPAAGENARISADIAVPVPDASSLAVVAFRRSLFVKRETKVEAASGVLVSASATKPSELLEAALIPVRIVHAAFGAASEVVQLRINLGQAEQKLAAGSGEKASVTRSAGGTGAGDVTAPTPPTGSALGGAYAEPPLIYAVASAGLSIDSLPAWDKPADASPKAQPSAAPK